MPLCISGLKPRPQTSNQFFPSRLWSNVLPLGFGLWALGFGFPLYTPFNSCYIKNMRVAILADIHANLPALESVYKDFSEEGAEEIWCLGDTVGYGAEPFACLQMLTDLDAVIIAGNHEQAACDLADTGHPAGFLHQLVPDCPAPGRTES